MYSSFSSSLYFCLCVLGKANSQLVNPNVHFVHKFLAASAFTNYIAQCHSNKISRTWLLISTWICCCSYNLSWIHKRERERARSLLLHMDTIQKGCIQMHCNSDQRRHCCQTVIAHFDHKAQGGWDPLRSLHQVNKS